MTAVANDEKAKQMFDEFNGKYGELSTTTKDLMNSFKQMAPVTRAMLDISDVGYSDMDDYNKMADIYQKLADAAKSTTIDNTDLKEAVDKIAEASAAYANYFQHSCQWYLSRLRYHQRRFGFVL